MYMNKHEERKSPCVGLIKLFVVVGLCLCLFVCVCGGGGGGGGGQPVQSLSLPSMNLSGSSVAPCVQDGHLLLQSVSKQ